MRRTLLFLERAVHDLPGEIHLDHLVRILGTDAPMLFAHRNGPEVIIQPYRCNIASYRGDGKVDVTQLDRVDTRIDNGGLAYHILNIRIFNLQDSG